MASNGLMHTKVVVMGKYALFGAGKIGAMAFQEYEGNVECFIDNYKSGTEYLGRHVYSLEEFLALDNHAEVEILVCVTAFTEIVNELLLSGTKFSIYHGAYRNDSAPLSIEIAHGRWPYKLKELCDFEGKEILEVGSRVVTGSNFRPLFEKANYTGFDLYEGPNVDVTGDAHRLSEYFDKKFDLIFSSAVFEHLAMPWVVADEMIKLCKPGGYIFVETHYSYVNHERPWHFFQFSEQALKVLFSENRGIRCIEAGVSNPMISCFTDEATEDLKGIMVGNMFCHSEFLGQKIEERHELNWNPDYKIGMYPMRKE